MSTHNATNERIKHEYFAYLKEAKRQCEATVDTCAKALDRFETYTKHRDFKRFHPGQAIGFKKQLAEENAHQSGKKLSKATLYSTCMHLKRFFQWLVGRPGYKSRFSYSDAEYFNLSEKDTRIATARREQKVPTLEQIKRAINLMPASSEIERRNRAVIAFTILTGARDGAMASMNLKHIDLTTNSVDQDAREVKTKFSKTFKTSFFPVGDELRKIVEDWILYLRHEKLWGNDDPIFPATLVGLGPNREFEAAGLKRAHWNNASSIRTIFREAFADVGLPYFNPHSFRNTLALLGQEICRTPEQLKAWSQNLGHEKVLTTLLSYGEVPSHRQGEIMRDLAMTEPTVRSDVVDMAEALVRRLLDSRRNASSLNRV